MAFTPFRSDSGVEWCQTRRYAMADGFPSTRKIKPHSTACVKKKTAALDEWPGRCRVSARWFILSSAVLAERVNADHQTGDGEQDIKQLNIRHTHHLRFCIAATEATSP